MNKILPLIIVIICCCSCASTQQLKSNTTSFYFWKTQYELSKPEQDILQETKAKKIYFRAFDIKNSYSAELIEPNQVMLWTDEPTPGIAYIPTVYVDYKLFLGRSELSGNDDIASADEVITRVVSRATAVKTYSGPELSTIEIDALAKKIVSLCKQIMDYKNLELKEIQIDCDWTERSKDGYFQLLRSIKEQNINVSSTLRLWQYKMTKTSGIPPADYVTLMCYNMGELGRVQNSNSILQLDVLESYLAKTEPYPLPVNVAMPIFTWYITFENNEFKGIKYNLPEDSSTWKKDSNKIIFTKPHYDTKNQTYFNQQTILIEEQVSNDDLQKALELINKLNINTKHETIYFSLDSSNILRHRSAITK
jgi:hypothetical protein